MAEKLENAGEIAVALDGIRGQLSLFAKVFAGVVGMAVLVTGAMFYKLDNVEDLTARIDTRLQSIEGKMENIVTSSNQANDKLDSIAQSVVPTMPVMSNFPSPEAFEDWKGIQVHGADRAYFDKLEGLVKENDPLWIYYKPAAQ